MAENVKFRTVFVGDDAYEVFVDTFGRFTTSVKGERITMPTFDGLEDAIKKARRKSKLRFTIAICRLNSNGTVDEGTVTGKNRATDKLMVSWKDGSREQESTWNKYHRPLTDGQKAEWKRLCGVVSEAMKAREAFETTLGPKFEPIKEIAAAEAATENNEKKVQ